MSDGNQKSKSRPLSTIKLDTPQQDRDWSEEQKIAWVKSTTQKILTAFTQDGEKKRRELMDADEKARIDGERLAEMMAAVVELAAESGRISGPEQRRRLRALLEILQLGFRAIDHNL